MLPRHQRLRSNQDFQRVYRVGRSWAHPLLALNVLSRPGEQRVGISVSKKVGKAVQRNLVRRRLRELLRASLPHWKVGFDAVVVARASAADASYSELAAAVSELARRGRLRREPDEAPDTPYRLPEGGRPGTSNRLRKNGGRREPAANQEGQPPRE